MKLAKLFFLIITLIPVLGFTQSERVLQAEHFYKKHLKDSTGRKD